MALSRKKPAKKKPFDFAKRTPAALASLSAKPAKKVPEQHGEKCLHMHCAKWLQDEYPNLLAFHVANERRGGIGTGVHFKRMGVKAGVADWLVFNFGRCTAIELKDEDGQLRPDQIIFKRQWEGQGHLYVVVRTLDEFKGVIAGITIFS